jgi:hypothetical protein
MNRLFFLAFASIFTLSVSACGEILDVFTDPSTRIASALEDAAWDMNRQGRDSYTLVYHFKPGHDGCSSGGYRLEMYASAGLLVACTAPTRPGDSGGLTTSHLPYVDVPRTLQITKQAGEPLYVDFTRIEGRIAVVGLR